MEPTKSFIIPTAIVVVLIIFLFRFLRLLFRTLRD